MKALLSAIAVVLLTIGGAAAQPVSTLPPASIPLSGAETTYIIQGGVSKKITVGNLLGGGGGTSYSDVTTTYTTSGAIALTDTLSMANCSTACTLTLAAGGAAVLQIIIHNRGSAVATITGTVEQIPRSFALPAAPAGGSITLRWLPSLTSWIII